MGENGVNDELFLLGCTWDSFLGQENGTRKRHFTLKWRLISDHIFIDDYKQIKKRNYEYGQENQAKT